MNEPNLDGVAIIGVHGRFPGAGSIDAFWTNLVAGQESISLFSDAELAAAGLDPVALRQAGKYVPARGVLAGAELFDASFFGIQPKEAEVMDPQHRVFLEASWEALERAGYASGRGAGSVGVYAGASNNTYYLHALHGRPDLRELVGADQVMLGNEKDYLATRVAYKLGLRGPAISLNTACSSSLVAVCLAQQGLLTYQCDLAVAGGVSIIVPQQRGYYFQDGSIGSPDGHTRTFDVQAGGVVPGNGVTLVVLKRLEDAVADGDRIFAVIKGAALNNDGSQKAGFGAPGIEGQSEVIALAQDLAGFDPDSISYVEAHGTATPIGDPIEVTSLTKAFRRKTQRKQFCAIGSVKTNIGHLDAAAGTAGLIKAALSLYHRQIPPSLHFTTPNPKLDLENSPFFVNAALRTWETPPGVPRRAGLSSFGIGGTNCHMVLEEAPSLPAPSPAREDQILVLSAKTPEALAQASQELAAHLRSHPEDRLADVAYTLQVGRAEFAHRRAIVANSVEEAAQQLAQEDPQRSATAQTPGHPPRVVFMFPGQGAQYVGMGAEIYRREPVFAEVIDQGAAILQPLLGLDLRRILFAPEPERAAADAQLRQTRLTQPALFLTEYAFAKLWMSWGVQPDAMIGHSVGEYVAACLAGVFSMETALRLVAKRAELVQAQAPGTMLAVRLPEAEVLPLLPPELSIAAINAPGSCVASGPEESIAALETLLAERKVAHKRLATSHAFHSGMMDPVIEPFTAVLRATQLAVPGLPYVSNVTAQWVTAEEATSPAYWAGHVRQAVRFSDGLALLLAEPHTLLVECGPSQTLAQLARQHPARKSGQTIITSLGPPNGSESEQLRLALGRAWLAGARIDWKAFQGAPLPRRVTLPTYAFQRRRFWPDAPVVASVENTPPALPATPSLTPPAIPTEPAPSPVPAPAPPSAAPPSRREHLAQLVRTTLAELSGADLTTAPAEATFLELGLDSLLLTQAATQFQRKFGVPVSFRQLLESLSSVNLLAGYLDERLPADRFAPAAPTPIPAPAAAPQWASAPAAAATPAQALPDIERLLEQQLRATTEMLQWIRGQGSGRAPLPPALTPPPSALQAAASAAASAPSSSGGTHGPFRALDRQVGATLTDPQKAFLADLIERYTRRTGASKKLAAKNRPHLADPRSAAGFKDLWKEMVYPIYTTRSEGARVWDADGNEYIDFVMGFGANLFGHRPAFVVEAIHRQLSQGFEIGPIQPIVGETAALFTAMTGLERVAFCNTGSEAVLAALRLARTVTGRDTIAVFSGAYHGVFDEVLVRPLQVNGEIRSAPIAPGIPGSSVSQMRVYDWANPASLELIRQHAHELAAVLVEPVQSRRLDVQPREFLRELRRLTQETGVALIFDEVVTGFRFHPGGAQAWYGIRADLASYGKVVGGGMPIGLVAGSARFMDALDGGAWQFGDDSFPEVGVTFFAGTFVRHPLIIAVAKAVLEHLQREGPSLQERVASLATRTAEGLREVIAQYGAPLRVAQASSIMYLTLAPEFRWGSLVFYLLRTHGLHVWENRAIVFTTAHTEQDGQRLVQALDEALSALARAGFFASKAEPGQTRAPLSLPPAPLTPLAPPIITAPVSTTPAAVAPQKDRDVFPLTDAQREVWLAALLDDKASQSYNLTFQLHLQGPLRRDVLQQCLQCWVDRHDSLRTVFDRQEAVQRVVPQLALPWQERDCPGGDPAASDAGLAALARAQNEETFDLTRAPLLRLLLVRRGAEDHVLILTVSHLIADGWSFGVLLHELKLSYAAGVAGRPAELELPLQYAQYAALLDGATVRASTARSEAFWQKRFAEPPAPLELPSDRPRPAQRTFGAGRISVVWERDFVRALKQASAQQGTTFLVYLLAGFQSLLRRLSGQSDLVVGVPAAGQIASSLEEPAGARALVGHCVHLLPLRVRCELETPFATFVKSVRTEVLDAFENQDISFGRLVELLKVRRDASRLPLAPIMFNLDRAPAGFQLAGLTTRLEEVPRRSLVFDLSINAVDDDAELRLDCDFNTDVYEAASVARWMRHFRTLLESALAEPATPIARLNCLGQDERQQILVAWNETQRPFPREQTVHALIIAQAHRTPQAVAAEFGAEQLTYGELDRRSNMLAAELLQRGVGVESLVGVYLERSLDLLVTVLGIWKAGGAYVPLDPAFPRERLAYMAKDAALTVIVTQARLVSELPPHQATVVCVDQPALSPSSEIHVPAAPQAGPENLAYVIYTSGSTGQPKGVEVLHRGVVNFLHSMGHTPGLTSEDILLAVTTLSFDIAGLELYLPLIFGAKVVIASRETAADGEKLAAELDRRGVTFMQATPTTWRLLLAAGWAGHHRLKALCGGEAFPPDLARQLIPKCGTLWNVYGPTETTIWSTCTQVRAEDTHGPISIGRPIDNTTLYILDGAHQPALIGVAGELYIGGDGVARGYRGRPELTSERFVPNPWHPESGERLYRTGDLARWLPDGRVGFIGRQDHQVKLRGYRIELGEIETVVARQAGVGQCVVLVREDLPGDQRLVAYVQPKNGAGLDPVALRQAVRGFLPDYMVPQHILLVEAFPLTPNGKIDRRALPKPGDASTAQPASASLARPEGAFHTPTEIALAGLWKKLLNVPTISRSASFFDLGGHSLLAVKLFAEIEKSFGCRLPLATILRAETLPLLASEIEAARGINRSWQCLVPIRPHGTRPPFFCVHGAGGEVLFARDLVRHFDADQPFYGLHARSATHPAERDSTVEAMAERYLPEITAAQPAGPYCLGGFCMGGLVAYEMAQRLAQRGSEVRLVVMIDTYNPIESSKATAKTSALQTWREKIGFQWSNFKKLPAQERTTYLRDRVQSMVQGRTKRLRERLVHYLQPSAQTAGLDGQSFATQEEFNDQVGMRYQPVPYRGDVLIIRPQTGFTFYNDPQMGWSNYIHGRLDVEIIPVNPGGLLVEPYVGLVGSRISQALQRAQQATST